MFFFYFPFLPGNLLFECNNFAGGVDAVMAMPGARSLSWSGLLGLRTGKNCWFFKSTKHTYYIRLQSELIQWNKIEICLLYRNKYHFGVETKSFCMIGLAAVWCMPLQLSYCSIGTRQTSWESCWACSWWAWSHSSLLLSPTWELTGSSE